MTFYLEHSFLPSKLLLMLQNPRVHVTSSFMVSVAPDYEVCLSCDWAVCTDGTAGEAPAVTDHESVSLLDTQVSQARAGTAHGSVPFSTFAWPGNGGLSIKM